MAKDNGASAEADRAVVNGAASVSAVPASVPSATPRHIIDDVGQKFADDVTSAALRSFQLVDDSKAAFVVGTFGSAAAIGLTAAAYVDASYGEGSANEMIDALWEFIRPMALSAAAQAIEARREDPNGSVHESAVACDAPHIDQEQP